MPNKPAARKKTQTPKHTFMDEVAVRFAGIEGYRSRAMFGGHGLYLGDSMFAIVDEGRVYFRVTDETRPDYEKAGMKPFEPWPGQVMAGYVEVPPKVWKDDVLRVEWARRAAMRTETSKKKRSPSKRK